MDKIRKPLPTFENSQNLSEEESTMLTNEGVNAIKLWLANNGIDVAKIDKSKVLKPLAKGWVETTAEVNIDPKTLGLMQPVFKKVTMDKASFAQNGDYLQIHLRYSWQHPSGSNGYTVRAQSEDLGKTWKVWG